MEELLKTIFSVQTGYSILRVTTPVLFAALAALVTNRAGVLNIAFEGIMLVAAFMGVVGSAYSQSVVVGILCGVVSGVAMASLLAYFSLKLKANIVLTGIALNTLASGGTIFALYLLVNDKGISTALPSLVVPNVELPVIKNIPILGPILSGHNLLTYLSFICIIVVYILVNRTVLGLRIKAVGENPDAASSVGIDVIKTKFIALVIGGILSSFGGIYMSMGYLSWFSRDMVAGRGFIAIAAQNLGGAEALPTLFAALTFGFADTISNILQTLRIPAEFVQMIPYVATLVGLVVYAERKQRKEKIMNK